MKNSEKKAIQSILKSDDTQIIWIKKIPYLSILGLPTCKSGKCQAAFYLCSFMIEHFKFNNFNRNFIAKNLMKKIMNYSYGV